jgi:uncharacterized phage-associated protein
MATIHDVAALIVREHGPTTAMKLQKLCYYAQAWSLAWGRGALFADPIEAWANGPVVRALWEEHRGAHTVSTTPGDPGALSREEVDTIRSVMTFYGHRDAEWLSELSHREAPWMEARRGLGQDVPSSAEITPDALRAYFGPIAQALGIGLLSESLARGCDLLLDVPPDEVPHLLDFVEVEHADVSAWLTNGGSPPWPDTSRTAADSC